MRCFWVLLLLLTITAPAQTKLHILGITQDGGYPHAGCQKQCCEQEWNNQHPGNFPVSFALVDSIDVRWWLFEATPDIKFQLQLFHEQTKGRYNYLPAGIFITHAHIGHYAGLMELGKEVMNTKDIPVYVLPKMAAFLMENGPWSQLVNLKNIFINPLVKDSLLTLNDRIRILTFTVPHRDEFSETAGYKIITENKSYLFIPDIDKWEKWDRRILEEVKQVDFALLDATFYKGDELPNRKISEVPHPFVSETMKIFQNEPKAVKQKIHFIHFNHTNPLLWDKNLQEQFNKSGFKLAKQGMRL